ncbi:MAG: acetylornithine transaminase [Alphaproteobacteria bacterium]|nr:acetylornithine transaminase [Alphaproteobacteria bacterium]|tara:strand:+ start:1381 stop:2550 length:1170 start_codon:yes stop_codon:yes gene_type:complete
MSSNVMTNYGRIDISFDKGIGSYLYTKDGSRYLDFASGIAVTCLGHSHPSLLAAIKTQSEKLWHVSNLYNIDSQSRLAERLCKNSFAERVFFCNSGAEAVEAALKLSRIYHDNSGNSDRWRVISFNNAFHGRTFATIAAAGQPKHLKGFEPKVRGFDHVEFGNIDAVKSAITNETAAVLVEPVQGEGGIHVASKSFLQDLREICNKHGLLLIFDEVQCGMGRTGRMWAYEWSEINPDIITVAKALGGGFPIGACMATEEVGSAFIPGTHGSTFGGNPMATTIANAVLDEIQSVGFLENVVAKGEYLTEKLELICKNSSVIEEVRGKGLMIGLQFSVPSLDVMAALRNKKLLTVIAEGNTLRLLPPLTVDRAEIDEACEAIEVTTKEFDT